MLGGEAKIQDSLQTDSFQDSMLKMTDRDKALKDAKGPKVSGLNENRAGEGKDGGYMDADKKNEPRELTNRSADGAGKSNLSVRPVEERTPVENSKLAAMKAK